MDKQHRDVTVSSEKNRYGNRGEITEGSRERVILHSDMNNFYASVECMLNPALRDKAIAVCGDVEERHGIVLAKNYPAKAYGVRTGEAIWQARSKCPDLVVVSPHYDEYMKFSCLAREIYSRYTECVEPFGMDECWLDCTATLGLFKNATAIAEEIRETVKTELGLTVSVGVSFNKVFAKLGSDMKKPDAVTVISRDDFRQKVWHLPATDMLGVGRATERALSSIGVRTIGQLAACPVGTLTAKFGKNGYILWRFANGDDNSPVCVRDIDVPDKSCGNGITTLQDLETPDEVWKVMLALSQEIGHRLYTFRKMATGIAIDIRDRDLHVKQWQCGLPLATQSPSVIARQAFLLFRRSYDWHLPIRTVTVRAINLTADGEPCQLSIFYDAQKQAKTEARDRCVEEIRRMFGNGAIRPAVLMNNPKMPDRDYQSPIMPTGVPL